jgi:nucleotide-binding universal stress UspA family protein
MTRRDFTALLAAALVPRTGQVARDTRRSLTSGITPPADTLLSGLSKVMEVAGVPGVGISVVRAGHPLWETYIGLADATTRQPISADTIFPAASLGSRSPRGRRCGWPISPRLISTGRSSRTCPITRPPTPAATRSPRGTC